MCAHDAYQIPAPYMLESYCKVALMAANGEGCILMVFLCVQGNAPVPGLSHGTGGMGSRRSPRVYPQPCQTATGKARGNLRKRKSVGCNSSIDMPERVDGQVQRWLAVDGCVLIYTCMCVCISVVRLCCFKCIFNLPQPSVMLVQCVSP